MFSYRKQPFLARTFSKINGTKIVYLIILPIILWHIYSEGERILKYTFCLQYWSEAYDKLET